MLLRALSNPAPAGLQNSLLKRPELSGLDRAWLVAAVASAHVLGFWALLQVPAVREAVRELAPMVVDLVAVPPPEPASPPPAPAPPPPPPPLRTPQPPKPLPAAAPQAPPLLAAPAAETPAAAAFTAPPPVPAVLQSAAQATVAAAAPTAPAAPPSPPPAPPAPPRKVVAANAVRYLVEPPVEVPRASRRAGEHGTVWLRVVVSAQGLPAQVNVARSSGHRALDEQALWAMRQARFKPHTEDGRAIEVEVTAPIEYPLE